MRSPLSRKHCPLKLFLEWTTLGIFLILLFTACLVCYGNENGTWTNAGIEQSNTLDNDDIEAKILQPRSGGVVWGTVQSKPSEIAESTPTTPGGVPLPTVTPLPNRERPVPAPSTAEPARAAATLQPVAQPPAQAASSATSRATSGKYLLRSGRQKGSTDLVETLLEVTGDATQIGSDLKEKREKMEVVAGFRYEERIDQFSPTGQLVSIRQYNLAKSRMRVGDNIRMPELASELQTIVCILDNDKVALFSPHGSLRGEQLLLIEDIPGNTLTLDRLLPNTEVAIGESWKITDNVLRSFLSVDAIIASDVEAVLTAVADDIAMVEIVGDVSGIYLGAATELSVRAKLQFDLTARRINWIGAMIEECRAIGHVGPGVELIAKLQVKISPIEPPQALTDAVVNTIATRPNESVLKLKYDGGKGPWRFSHNRDWYVYQDEPQATVLRKLVDGELVAQCNIADMGKVDVRAMSTLGKFQQDLVTGLGDNFGRIALAQEYEDKRGYKVYKVILDGMVDDLSLRWIYHLITDTDGTQSIVVFVVEAAMLDQFANTDDVLLETYRMGR
ncbi:MAG: hypothetical protein FWG73_04225 [Planctomycetaceae bacterium]|nr:hypothetical protein [Planctomycetaceae bacterium]